MDNLEMFNIALLAATKLRTTSLTSATALNMEVEPCSMIRTQDDHLLVVDLTGHRFDVDRDGVVHSSRCVGGHYTLKANPLASGAKSKRPQQYAYMTLDWACGDGSVRMVQGVHDIVALGFDRQTFYNLLTVVDSICVNHMDNTDWNNKATNLEWCSYSDNGLHGEYVKNLATRYPNSQGQGKLFRNVDRRYLNVGVQVYSLRFALTLFKIVNGNVPAFDQIMDQLGSIIDIDYLIADPNTVDSVRAACLAFKNEPDFVTKLDVVDAFVDAFEHHKDIKIVF